MTDSCPNCVHRGVEPTGERREGDQITHDYVCPNCGHEWFTGRYLPAYSELHNRRGNQGTRPAAEEVA